MVPSCPKKPKKAWSNRPAIPLTNPARLGSAPAIIPNTFPSQGTPRYDPRIVPMSLATRPYTIAPKVLAKALIDLRTLRMDEEMLRKVWKACVKDETKTIAVAVMVRRPDAAIERKVWSAPLKFWTLRVRAEKRLVKVDAAYWKSPNQGVSPINLKRGIKMVVALMPPSIKVAKKFWACSVKWRNPSPTRPSCCSKSLITFKGSSAMRVAASKTPEATPPTVRNAEKPACANRKKVCQFKVQ
jgi:hypothetical protein